jgi:SSS family solute:Na+ symporter
VLWFNVAHYGLRPWPWILVALASLVVYPAVSDIQAAFPGLDPSILGHDLAYPAMLVFLPSGLLGLVVASLAAAYMSTISTHLNWGASYVVQDAYRRFLRPEAPEGHYVAVARVTTVVLTVLMGLVALLLSNALQAFQILLQIGAGTGLVFLLRWFWWRVNAWSEISAMVISFGVALYFSGGVSLLPLGIDWAWMWSTPPWSASTQLVAGVFITTIGWLLVTFATPATSSDCLRTFYRTIRPMGPGWDPYRGKLVGTDARGPYEPKESLSAAALAWFLGCILVYAGLFGTGYILFDRTALGVVLLMVSAACGLGILRLRPKIGL